MRPFLFLCACLTVLGACGERAANDETPANDSLVTEEIFAGLPVMQGARLGGRSGDAAEAVVNVPVSADSAGRFYRNVLIERAWDLRGDATGPDGQVMLHARSAEGRPIWIMIEPTGPKRARISVIASAPDSAAPRP